MPETPFSQGSEGASVVVYMMFAELFELSEGH
jgi:hypothetical protein